MNVYGVVMAGGGGTRFWPLSRNKTPKQLLNLSGKDTMVNEAIDRLRLVTERENIYVVTNKTQIESLRAVVGDRVAEENVFSEPAMRNTSACIGYAAVELLKRRGDGVMVIVPSDAYLRDDAQFAEKLNFAIQAAETSEKLVTIGITPTFPATGYGYIRFQKSAEPVKKALRFVEKPKKKLAEKYIKSGDYVWNSGMFIWKVSTILEKFRTLLPDIYVDLMKIYNAIGTAHEKRTISSVYPKISSISVDYGVMEKCKDILVVPGDFGWSDVGSWDMLGVLHSVDECGNIVMGDGLALETRNSVLYAGKKFIATVGVKDMIIVDTEDALLICPKSRAQDVKKIVDELRNQGREDLL